MVFGEVLCARGLEFCKSETGCFQEAGKKLFGSEPRRRWRIADGEFFPLKRNWGLSGKKSADEMTGDRPLGVDGEGLASNTASRRPGSFCKSEHTGFFTQKFSGIKPDRAMNGRDRGGSTGAREGHRALRSRPDTCNIIYYSYTLVKGKSVPARGKFEG